MQSGTTLSEAEGTRHMRPYRLFLKLQRMRKSKEAAMLPAAEVHPADKRNSIPQARKQIAGYLYAKDVSEIMGVAVPTAYKVIRDLNDKLAAEGYITVSGRIPENYFRKHCPV